MDLVTGGTGFIGAHVVRALLARGREVRCLVRRASRRANLEGLPVEIVTGDVTDPASLARAALGARTVYHCAADYRLDARNPEALFAANVAGTDNVIRAAAESGAERIVYTSSVGALGLRRDGLPADEETVIDPDTLVGAYKRSKYDAQRAALAWAGRGAPVVIVNPSTPVGELDVKPTPTGRVIVDFLNRRMPAYVDTGLNVVDVRDVAEGHLLAAERGRAGASYILGNRNMTLKEILDALAAITRLPSPSVKLPHWVPVAAARADRLISRVVGREPRISLEGARMARHRMFFDAARAVRELGLPQSPIEPALERAVEWFRANGYAAVTAVRSPSSRRFPRSRARSCLALETRVGSREWSARTRRRSGAERWSSRPRATGRYARSEACGRSWRDRTSRASSAPGSPERSLRAFPSVRSSSRRAF